MEEDIRNGEMGKWGNGEMGKWGNGEMTELAELTELERCDQ